MKMFRVVLSTLQDVEANAVSKSKSFVLRLVALAKLLAYKSCFCNPNPSNKHCQIPPHRPAFGLECSMGPGSLGVSYSYRQRRQERQPACL
ncbi:hypothetical protein RRG08_058575 [Elysia crispata]|uniref:Uncharacterized protein n=1 Tax=Elysia crispata TaxID=231223 RepID=A0AAE1CM70_9GAST|nr:hypothetical protein RRG08_058575 [Elysia crispata]